jgi:hypothetical protein
MEMENENKQPWNSFGEYKDEIDFWYRKNNISRERVELFYDFLISLHQIMEQTYLGSDVINTLEETKKHFDWCWNKTIENFKLEKIFFRENVSHHDYVYGFYYEGFYKVKMEGDESKIPEYIYKLFNEKYIKTPSLMEIFTYFYFLFDYSLKK